MEGERITEGVRDKKVLVAIPHPGDLKADQCFSVQDCIIRTGQFLDPPHDAGASSARFLQKHTWKFPPKLFGRIVPFWQIRDRSVLGRRYCPPNGHLLAEGVLSLKEVSPQQGMSGNFLALPVQEQAAGLQCEQRRKVIRLRDLRALCAARLRQLPTRQRRLPRLFAVFQHDQIEHQRFKQRISLRQDQPQFSQPAGPRRRQSLSFRFCRCIVKPIHIQQPSRCLRIA